MPDRLRKYPKRDERQGHQWFKPSFQQKAEKYFHEKHVSSISLTANTDRLHSPYTYAELALHLLRVTGIAQNVPPQDKNKLLQQLEARASGASSSQKDGGEKKKKKKK